jgi:hypothetical protein
MSAPAGAPPVDQPTGQPTAPPPQVVPPVPDDQRAGGQQAILADLAKERDKRQAAETALAEREAKITEFERAGMKDIEKVTAERDDLKNDVVKHKERAEKAEQDFARFKIAVASGLSEADVADLNTNGTIEEWQERVKRLAERLGVTPTGAAPQSKGRPARGLPPAPTASREGNPGSSSTAAGAAAYAARHKKAPASS